ncbi:hypothetical protein glysoja_006738 [Glycine soja]|nr:hypothetical protein glysoja_006738 [Glycine soja]
MGRLAMMTTCDSGSILPGTVEAQTHLWEGASENESDGECEDTWGGLTQQQTLTKIHTDVLTKARDSCYNARDAFYACLEKESDKKPTEIASVGLLYPVECKTVKHFDRQYCQNKRVQRLLDDKGSRRGPLTLPQPFTF